MPSGSHGCFICGAKTDAMIIMRVEDFTDELDARGNRKRRVMATKARAFCEDCSGDAWDAMSIALDKAAKRRVASR